MRGDPEVIPKKLQKKGHEATAPDYTVFRGGLQALSEPTVPNVQCPPFPVVGQLDPLHLGLPSAITAVGREMEVNKNRMAVQTIVFFTVKTPF